MYSNWSQDVEYSGIYRGFPTRMMYLHYISCLGYTILVGNHRYLHNESERNWCESVKSKPMLMLLGLSFGFSRNLLSGVLSLDVDQTR